MSKELNKAPVEQAGGDERAVDGKPRATKCPDCGEGDLMPGDLCACGYETDPAAGYACSECDGSGDGYVGEVCRECDGSGWFVTPEQARADLAQPSPKCATCNGSGQVWISDEPQRHFEDCPDCAQPSLAPTEGFSHFPELLESVQQMDAMLKAEAERPDVVAVVRAQGFGRVCEADANTLYQHCSDGDELMTVAQHERIVKAWIERWKAYIELSAKIAAQRDAALAEVVRLTGVCASLDSEKREMEHKRDAIIAMRDAALARVAELEGQSGIEFVYDSDELVAVPRGLLGAACHAIDKKRDAPRTIAKLREYARGLPAPVAQAQHSVPELDQSRSALTEAQMRRIYENSTEAENERLGFAAFARLMRRAEAVHQIAAAPGKEGL
ncbi:TPA: hypothetical protein SLU67_002746 [Pseudomonas aeruginosa]|nr:hypothetical protein [Pseudomonas aeruginosa]